MMNSQEYGLQEGISDSDVCMSPSEVTNNSGDVAIEAGLARVAISVFNLYQGQGDVPPHPRWSYRLGVPEENDA